MDDIKYQHHYYRKIILSLSAYDAEPILSRVWESKGKREVKYLHMCACIVLTNFVIGTRLVYLWDKNESRLSSIPVKVWYSHKLGFIEEAVVQCALTNQPDVFFFCFS